jgi:hypothetical protein
MQPDPTGSPITITPCATTTPHDRHSSDEGPEATCRRCGGPNITWSAPSPLWNAVMRGGDINADDDFGGIVCPVCFGQLAQERGVASMWRLDAEHVQVKLPTVTPSGRVWDPQRWLWRAPDASTDEAAGEPLELLTAGPVLTAEQEIRARVLPTAARIAEQWGYEQSPRTATRLVTDVAETLAAWVTTGTQPPSEVAGHLGGF